MDKITEKVKYFLEKYDLLDFEKPILIAFSGGYDSMCLLDILCKFRKNVIAIHLNHNWRGEESDAEEEKCRKFCARNGVEFYSEKLSSDIPKTETAARKARYDFFEKCAEKFSSNAVLTAHNANDNAETLIYRIAKGTGTKGLSGIAEHRGIFYRPLLEITREDIENYAYEHNLTPNNDSSNSDIKYKRNLIRKNILPQMEKINPHMLQALNSLSERARLDNEIIEEYTKSIIEPYKTSNFTGFSEALKSRLVYNLFVESNLDYDRLKIQRALDFILENKDSKSGKTFSLSDNLRLFVNTETIEIIKNPAKRLHEIKIGKEGRYKLDNYIFIIEKSDAKIEKFPKDSELTAYVDLSAFKDLTLRGRKDGDIIKPLGCSGSQKLKKYLNEKKVSAHKKAEMLFLASGNEILWAPSLGLSDKIKVFTKQTHVLKLIKNEMR